VSADNRPILCLGEAIVDLITEARLEPGEAPGSLVPHPGGALANVAVAVARRGGPAALAGGVGDDLWGSWLAGCLESEGVSTDWLETVPGAATPVALIRFDPRGEPAFQVYGEHIGPTMEAVAPGLGEAIAASSALLVGSNTMVGEAERAVTRSAVKTAGELGLPVLLDPNHRPTRWSEEPVAVGYGLELARCSTVVKCNRGEAELLTGVADPSGSAAALAELGPDLVVVTDGPGRIVTAGAATAEWQPGRTEVVSPLGAGDAFMGSLAAGLAGLGWNLSRVGEVLPDASDDATACCRHWGAWR
jgi:fructokinase